MKYSTEMSDENKTVNIFFFFSQDAALSRDYNEGDYRVASKAQQSPFCLTQSFLSAAWQLFLLCDSSMKSTSLLQAEDHGVLQTACSPTVMKRDI